MMDASVRTPASVSASALSKVYSRGREKIHALREVSFTIGRGEFVAIVGPSGAGKTSLLNLIGCMDAPSSGTLIVAGHEVQALTERDRTQLRRNHIGFVFQHFGLLPTLTVAENVALPALFARRKVPARVEDLILKAGLSPRRDHRPHQLSGGEMQRVAIVRALINSPQILLADEPTGNLDSATGGTIIELFRQLSSEGLTIIVVTHNPAMAAAAHRQMLIRDGQLETPACSNFSDKI
jgi:putative ABC transport system ATP-binding protein